ncbi:hypothetical protein ACFFIX_09350 [Metabacillus herbersteinensis]|uniref:IDEAL domain-containing protein n=1 Tax=Metabacillus herbersteinensis TaxID=283816 RepID=A0ABV6GDA8_9BACI
MFGDDQFQLISKALHTTYQSLLDNGYESNVVERIDMAKEDLIKALAHSSSVDHKLLIQSLFDNQ